MYLKIKKKHYWYILLFYTQKHAHRLLNKHADNLLYKKHRLQKIELKFRLDQ